MLRLRTWGCKQTKCCCRWDWLWVEDGSEPAGGEPGAWLCRGGLVQRLVGGLGKAGTLNKVYHSLGVGTGGSVLGMGECYGDRDKSKLEDFGQERNTDTQSQHSM